MEKELHLNLITFNNFFFFFEFRAHLAETWIADLMPGCLDDMTMRDVKCEIWEPTEQLFFLLFLLEIVKCMSGISFENNHFLHFKKKKFQKQKQ